MLNTQILVGLYHCDEELDRLAASITDDVGWEGWCRGASEAYEIAADWMEDAGATGDDVARVAMTIRAKGKCMLLTTADRVAAVMYLRESPQVQAEYDAAFAHLS